MVQQPQYKWQIQYIATKTQIVLIFIDLIKFYVIMKIYSIEKLQKITKILTNKLKNHKMRKKAGKVFLVLDLDVR